MGQRVTGHEPELRKFVAPEFVFGIGARTMAGQYVRNLGARCVLVVTDPGVRTAGWAESVIESVERAGVRCAVFDGVTPNPKDTEVALGVEAYKTHDCDVLVSVGGGSVTDCAKGIGIVVSNASPIGSYEGVDQIRQPTPPLVCVPTTGGTSADVSQFCIITNTQQRVKMAIISKAVVPDVSLIDPATLTTMDPYLTACTAMDAIVHGVEAFVSNASSPMTDLHALEGIRLVASSIQDCLANPDDLAPREAVMRGALQAGLAFSNASLGGVHAMAHSLGGFKDLPHGECNSLLLRHVVDFNYSVAAERYAAIGSAFGLHFAGLSASEQRRALLEHVDGLARSIGISGTLGRRGVSASDVPVLAANALHDACIVTNPRRPNKRDLEVIYEEAL